MSPDEWQVVLPFDHIMACEFSIAVRLRCRLLYSLYFSLLSFRYYCKVV